MIACTLAQTTWARLLTANEQHLGKLRNRAVLLQRLLSLGAPVPKENLPGLPGVVIKFISIARIFESPYNHYEVSKSF